MTHGPVYVSSYSLSDLPGPTFLSEATTASLSICQTYDQNILYQLSDNGSTEDQTKPTGLKFYFENIFCLGVSGVVL